MQTSSHRLILTAVLTIGVAGDALADPAAFSRDTVGAAARPRAIVAADLNRDGLVDIATAGTGPSVAIYLNTGDGSFRPGENIPVGGGPFDMVAADLNRDGFLDLVIANADLDAVTIIPGSSRGPQATRDLPLPGNPRGIAVADVTRDGIPDILVTQYEANSWTLLAGDGAFGVASRSTFTTAAHPQGIAVADVNHDGRPDAVVANAGASSISTFYNAGAAAPTRRDTSTGTPLNVVATGDLNRDGWVDVVAASSGNSTAVVLRGSASGFTKIGTLATGVSPRGIEVADWNSDGVLDVATADRASNTVTVHFGRGDGTFGESSTLAGGVGSRAVAAADFNSDGRIDLVVANETDGSATVFLNRTPLVGAANVFTARDYGFVGNGTEMEGAMPAVVADFDHDGLPDFAVSGGGVGIYLARGSQLTIGSSFVSGLAGADFNRDGNPDVIASSNGDDRVDVLLGDGRGGFAAPKSISLSAPLDVLAGDFTRDGIADFVVVARATSGGAAALRLFVGRGDGSFVASTQTTLPYNVVTIASGDIDGDDCLDIVASLGYPSVPELRVFFGDGTGGWRDAQRISMSQAASSLAIAPVTAGGRPDIVAGTSGAIVIISSVMGTFAPPVYVPVAPDRPAWWIGVGDVNLDGRLDIVTSGNDIYFGNGDMTFSPAYFAGTGSGPRIEDVTGDGVPDIVLAEFQAVRVLVGARDERNRPPTVEARDESINYALIDDGAAVWAYGSDPDMHELTYEWRDASGRIVGDGPGLTVVGDQPPGTYTFTVTASDGRGGSASATATVTVLPYKEINMRPANYAALSGAWKRVDDPTAASGVRLQHPDAGAAKLTAPLANPTHYFELAFRADPTQTYKLWIRGKAERNAWSNDSVFVQFSGSTDSAGNARWRLGSTDALAVNIEECSGCGLSGWGWEDDGWGAVNRNGTTLRFPEGGWQRIRVQTREDGIGIDQIVLSSEKYLTTRPGAAKNDTTIVEDTVVRED
ncbi:MAG TPA: FG-GAP-like repeat-containing protein [Vicinamibacterales bacterium]|jgi:hypothetical protein|nr:FG-GAP-like repeat-containing protein [Vicinamibacterales bacterium]